MWVLTQTQPKSSRADIRAAVSTLVVQTDEARPYSVSLAIRSASSSSVNFCTVITGPKISVLDQLVVLLQVGDDRRLVEVAAVARPARHR